MSCLCALYYLIYQIWSFIWTSFRRGESTRNVWDWKLSNVFRIACSARLHYKYNLPGRIKRYTTIQRVIVHDLLANRLEFQKVGILLSASERKLHSTSSFFVHVEWLTLLFLYLLINRETSLIKRPSILYLNRINFLFACYALVAATRLLFLYFFNYPFGLCTESCYGPLYYPFMSV